MSPAGYHTGLSAPVTSPYVRTRPMKLEGAKIIGIVTLVSSTTPFDRGDVIIQGADGSYLHVDAYPDGETAVGKPYTEDGVNALRSAGQLLGGESIPAAAGAAGWVLRGDFDELRRLLMAFKLVLGAFGTGKDLLGYVIREDSIAASLREAWAAASRLQTIKALRANNLDAAVGHARCALSFHREMTPEVIALIAYVHERLGQKQRAAGYKLMAKRSRGEQFVVKLEAAWADLERMLRT